MAHPKSKELIQKHMKAGFAMTPRIAIIRWSYYRLSSLICRWRKELKEQGAKQKITTQIERSKYGSYAVYRLVRL